MRLEVLTPFFTTNKKSVYPTLIPYLEQAFEYADINTAKRASMFLSNCCHETANFSQLRENLNYTPESLAKTWPSRFMGPDKKPKSIAYKLCYDREMRSVNIANYVYANRYGNAGPESGDGYRYRGGGLPHLTFKDNYAEVDKAFDMNGEFLIKAHLIETPYWACMSAAYFWKSRNMNYRADNNHLKVGRKIWNGSTLGLQPVLNIYNRILPILQNEYASK